jgi:hypothetical protein
MTLAAQDRTADAIAVYDDVIAKYSDATESEIRDTVADAERRKGLLTKPQPKS